MFTGIIEAVGTVRTVSATDGGLEITISHPWVDVQLGESVAVNGACLTIEAQGSGDFTFHIIRTSLDRTNFGTYGVGRRVNLERAVRVGDRLGGHIVQGHVDGVGMVRQVRHQADARLIDIEAPADVARVSMPLGSITVDGVSLTVNALPARQTIQVSLIPFTLQHTTLDELQSGNRVHLEADAIGKYVRFLMERERENR
jgi:riboflavin synthase